MVNQPKAYNLTGTDAPWYRGWNLTEDQREVYRKRSRASQLAKARALSNDGTDSNHPINEPKLDPFSLMPRCRENGLQVLSLFSGGGGLDLGFDMAGFRHAASYEILPYAS